MHTKVYLPCPTWTNFALPLTWATHKSISNKCCNHTTIHNCSSCNYILNKVITNHHHKTLIFGQNTLGRCNHENPLSFDVAKDFQTFCLQEFYHFPCSMCLLGEWEKYTYIDYNKTSIFPTNNRFKIVCMAKLHLCVM